jgi:hypothetical protein
MLEQLMVVLLLARVRRTMTWRWRMMPLKRLARAASLGGPGHILSEFGLLLTTRVHLEIRGVEDKLDNKDGLDRI